MIFKIIFIYQKVGVASAFLMTLIATAGGKSIFAPMSA